MDKEFAKELSRDPILWIATVIYLGITSASLFCAFIYWLMVASYVLDYVAKGV